ncbi:MAG: sirohydrochlorin cobaltochelatase [Clostridium sp.]|jgi:sirohydrochlorin cobaltochelatase|uniref:sirohydrochlorin cobaltochelatase n=1 Tax=Clostridium sp. TaxID=1506 RepID=UPI0025BF88B4|nr:sirohydrochlorin cobaltochelatase [Clostridium sp.]MCH3962931.1 sirohydrochlorin cobaltochelatase [Clostridium sp.]MCI1715654.1 sirohydrochlorin cobaltochelatase [Clostridium sp.]MCI1800142.1 sirohydrochlorin cobaltochelatase [Clostridium sp.]MCI1814055.1 sirohydrochlorin cobaltochelatase [Clostridium sp.]MCI1870953.1 sirohydrochlorin cobaltochelatase [Clostridium sp.]
MVENERGILIVSFGTSIPKILKSCIESTENSIKNAFKSYEVRRAFTSHMIIDKLKKDYNLSIDTVEEALEEMELDGFREVYIQPLHIIPGDEYDKLVASSCKYSSRFESLVIGRPVLYRQNDYRIAVKALRTQIQKYCSHGSAIILMGHGSSHPINASYSMLQYMLRDEGINNAYIATVEGYPALENVIPQLEAKNVEKVMLMPFMLVAGNHAFEDMAGSLPDSWKNILEREGFDVKCYMHGLGENPCFHSIYIQHLKDSINGNPLMKEDSYPEAAIDSIRGNEK